MDDMHRLIEKYKRELMEYSKAAAPQKPLDFPEMIPDAENSRTETSARQENEQPSAEPISVPGSEPVPEPMPAPEPRPEPIPEPEPAPDPQPEPIPEPEREPDSDPDTADSYESSDSSEGTGRRKPEIIGYVGSDDALGEYGNIFSDLIPRAETDNAKAAGTQYDLPSQRENSDNNTKNSVPEDNIPPSGEVSGVTDNTPSQPPPELANALEVPPERAEELARQPESGLDPDEQLTGRSFENDSGMARSRDDIKPINTGEPPVYTEQEYSSYEDFSEKNPSTGQLRFLVFTARSALPVKGAECRVSKSINDSVLTMFSLVTDESGQTPIVHLPTKPKANSQTPSEDGVPPYSVYDAVVSAEGFDTVIYKNIPIFSGILSVQRVAMIPSSDVPGQQNENNGGV